MKMRVKPNVVNKENKDNDMNLDKNLIRHWAMLFESEEQKMNNENLFLEENDGKQNILTRKMVHDMAVGGDTEFEIPRGITSIEANAFYYRNSLKKVMIPDSVVSIGDYAFQHCYGLESVIIPGSVKIIGNFAFNECVGLKNVTIEDGVEEIRDFAFSDCEKLESLTIGKGVKNICICAFENCTSLINVVIPDGVTNIGIGVFQNCSRLESVTIPIGLTEISDGMFFGCRSLKSVTIPSSVKGIGKDVFGDCGNLKELIFQGKTEDEVKQMENYPWGIENPESVIRGNHDGDIDESKGHGSDQEDGDSGTDANEAMSPAEIMASWNKNHADDEKKAAEEKAKKDAEAQARGIKQITINSVGDDGTIKYTIVRNDGRTSEEEEKGLGTDDEEFKRTKRMLRTMSGKTPDDLDVFVAMLRRSFDSASKNPIQWYYHFDRGEEGRLDDDWYYRPSEDYLGYTPDFVQSIFDAGGRIAE